MQYRINSLHIVYIRVEHTLTITRQTNQNSDNNLHISRNHAKGGGGGGGGGGAASYAEKSIQTCRWTGWAFSVSKYKIGSYIVRFNLGAYQ